jgi:thioredoxin reductase (NADPH)
MDDVIVIGSGPAGMAAALYTARANLVTRLITGPQLGGQVALTWEIENYPGFPEAPSGADLTDLLSRQVAKFGAEVVYDEVTAVDFTSQPLRVMTYGGDLEARAVVVATGASARRLGVPGEEELIGRGVSYCATCDGAFFKDRDVVVVGGGDSAVEEAVFLTRFARSIRIVHRRDQLRAGVQLQRRAQANEKISYVWSTVVEEVVGTTRVERLKVRRVDSGETTELTAGGVFIFVGHDPNSRLLAGALALDDHGYVKVDDRMQTSVTGVFAAGEIMDPVWRQVATSVGQGAMAGISAVRYLGALE